MKKIYLFLFSLFICNILAAQDQDYKIVRDILIPNRKIHMRWNVVNWIFIIPRTQKISLR